MKRTLLQALIDNGLVKSKSEGRRLIAQGAVRINGDKIKDPEVILPEKPRLCRIGRGVIKVLL